MKITNYRPQDSLTSKSLAVFDIEEIKPEKFDLLTFRNWELRRSKTGHMFVDSKLAYVDEFSEPGKKLYRHYIELIPDVRKLFSQHLLELLEPFCGS